GEDQRRPPPGPAPLDGSGRDGALPGCERDDRVAAGSMHDQRTPRCRGGEEREPAGHERQSQQDEQGEVGPAFHQALAASARPISSLSDTASSDGNRRSASLRSRSVVNGLGTATQKSCAAFAARMPLVESSNAMVSSGDTSRRSTAVRYSSGSGLVLVTSSRHTMTSKCPWTPNRSRCSITQVAPELDAIAILRPSGRASTRYFSTPGSSCCIDVASL